LNGQIVLLQVLGFEISSLSFVLLVLISLRKTMFKCEMLEDSCLQTEFPERQTSELLSRSGVQSFDESSEELVPRVVVDLAFDAETIAPDSLLWDADPQFAVSETAMAPDEMEMPRFERGEPQPHYRGGVMPLQDSLLGTDVDLPWLCMPMVDPDGGMEEVSVMPVPPHPMPMPVKAVTPTPEPDSSMRPPSCIVERYEIVEIGVKRHQGKRSHSGRQGQRLESFRLKKDNALNPGLELLNAKPLLLGNGESFPCVFAHDTRNAMGVQLMTPGFSMPHH
jgi:hypothetical protein